MPLTDARERPMSDKLLTPIEIGLTAAIVAIEGNEPVILTASGSDGDKLAGLPFGPFDAVSHRTFEIGLRAWVEEQAGLRWPDLALQGGRLGYAALREALPVRGGISVLSAGRAGREVDEAALRAVVDAGCRGGATVICDVPRRATQAAEAALDAADLVVLVTTADVRSCAATAALGQWLVQTNPNVGLVVRGPAPGGLTSADVANIVDLPLLAAMRPQPRLATTLEHGGLTIGRRSPLRSAALRVLAVLRTQPREAVVSGSA